MSETDPAQDRYADARLSLDRAHRAAGALEGGELRRALGEARDVLHALNAAPDANPLAKAATEKVEQALADLDAGPLDEAETLIEQARKDLAGIGAP